MVLPLFVRSALRFPGLVLTAVALCTLILGVGMTRLEFDSSYRAFFDSDDPQLLSYESVREGFEASDSLLLILEPEETLFSQAGLQQLREVVDQAWELPYVTRVESVLDWQQVRGSDSGIHIESLVPDAEVSDLRAHQIGLDAVAQAELTGRLVGVDGCCAAVSVTLDPQGGSLRSAQEIMHGARELRRRFLELHPGSALHLSGIVAMNFAFAEATWTDSTTLVPGLFLVLLLALFWCLGSWQGALLTGLTMAASNVAALGLAGWAGMQLDSATACAPLIVATLATAGSVHVLRACAAHEAEEFGAPRGLAVVLGEAQTPILLSAVTTALGLLTCNFSAVPPFRHLGTLVAFGAIYAAWLNLWALPALLRLMPRLITGSPMRLSGGRVIALVSGRRWVLPLTVAGVLVAVAGLARLEANDDFVDYFSERIEFRKAADFQADSFGGVYDIEFELESRSVAGIHDPRYLDELAAFGSWLRSQPEVRHVSLWSDPLGRLQQALHEADGTCLGEICGSVPDSAEVAAQLTLLLEMSLPPGQDLSNVIRRDEQATRALVVFGNLTSSQMRRCEQKILDWLQTNAPTLRVQHGSINLLFSHIGPRNWGQMVLGTLLAVSLIVVLVAVQMRSVLLGGIALVANLLPLLVGFGLWGWAIGAVSLSLSTAAAMTFGVIVDDSIHLLYWYRRARDGGSEVLEAWRHAIDHAGAAVLITTFVLCLGFCVLAASSFTLNAHLAMITLLILAIACAVDLLLLPVVAAALASSSDPAPGSHGPAG